MTAPANAVYRNGITPVTGDQFNTFLQTVTTVAVLRTFVGVTGMTIELLGFTTAGDAGAGQFWWNAASTAPDDGNDVIIPTASASGAWNRLPIAGFFRSGEFSGPPLLLGFPLGQSGNPAMSLVEITTETVQPVTNEFALSINMISSTGSTGSVATASDKVGLYVAVEAQPGSGNVWAINQVLILDAGACLIGGAQIAEFDLDNSSGVDFGVNILTDGLIQPALIGMQITGLGPNSASTAIAILGTSVSGGGLWNAGVYLQVGSINKVGILDEGSATAPAARISYKMNQFFTDGIDSNLAVFSGSAIRVGSQQKISARNAANAGDLTLLQTDGSDNLRLGSASNPAIQLFAPVEFIGSAIGFFSTSPVAQQTILGSRAGNAALADLLTKLALTGLIVDGTTA